MRRYLKLALTILLISIVSVGLVTAAESEKAAIVTEKGKLIEKQLDTYAQDSSFSGTVLLAVDNEIILAKGYGYADEATKRPNDINTVYEIASVSKQFAAAAIMQLVDQGKLSVDDTLEKYFPELVHAPKITVKNLLQMRSGLHEFFEFGFVNFRKAGYKSSEEFHEAIGADFQDAIEKKDASKFVIKNLNYMPLEYTPGEQYSYRTTNYFLLAVIVEQLSGMSYEDYVDKNMFQPCNMTTANMRYKGTTAVGYLGGQPGEYTQPILSKGGAEINAGVLDLYKWNMAIHGGKIVSEKSYTEMITFVDDYGYGFHHEPVSPNTGVYHTGGATSFGSANGVDFSKKYIIVVLTNHRGATVDALTVYKQVRALADSNIK